MKTKLEIIDETVAYYTEDVNRRAISGIICEYLTEDGRMCAVGRCMIAPKQEFKGVCSNIYTYENGEAETIEEPLDNLLKKEYRGHNIDFWKDLQLLHDCNTNWNNYGLSSTGIFLVNELKEKYQN